MDQKTLNNVKARILLNDRASAYLELYNLIRDEQLILQTQITTYSGAIGSMALVGNMLAKDAGGDKYNVSLDQFSLDILEGTYNLVDSFKGKAVSNFDDNLFQDADNAIWASKGLGNLFPGNVQFADYESHRSPENAKRLFNSKGSSNSIMMGGEFIYPNSKISDLGSRPADYKGYPEYEIIEGKRFITVIKKCSGSVVSFWDKNIYFNSEEQPVDYQPLDISQIENSPRIDDDYNQAAGNAVRNYVQADYDHIPVHDPSKSFDSFKLNFPKQNKLLDDIREEVYDEKWIPYYLKKSTK